MTILTAWNIFGGIVVIFLPETEQHKPPVEPEEER